MFFLLAILIPRKSLTYTYSSVKILIVLNNTGGIKQMANTPTPTTIPVEDIKKNISGSMRTVPIEELTKDKPKSGPKKLQKKNEEEAPKVMDPEAIDYVKELGIEFSDADVDQYIWKGYVDKTMDVIPDKLTVTLRSLTQKDQDFITEKLEEAMEKKIVKGLTLKDGYASYRTKWMLAISVQAINNEPLVIDLDEKFDYIASKGEWIFVRLSEIYNMYVLALYKGMGFDRIKKA